MKAGFESWLGEQTVRAGWEDRLEVQAWRAGWDSRLGLGEQDGRAYLPKRRIATFLASLRCEMFGQFTAVSTIEGAEGRREIVVSALQFITVHGIAMQFSTAQHCTAMQCNTIQCSAVQCCAVYQ